MTPEKLECANGHVFSRSEAVRIPFAACVYFTCPVCGTKSVGNWPLAAESEEGAE